MNIYVVFDGLCWPGYLSRHSDSLRDGRSRDRILVEERLSALVLQIGSGALTASSTVGNVSISRW